jgi:hypothetical protein
MDTHLSSIDPVIGRDRSIFASDELILGYSIKTEKLPRMKRTEAYHRQDVLVLLVFGHAQEERAKLPRSQTKSSVVLIHHLLRQDTATPWPHSNVTANGDGAFRLEQHQGNTSRADKV